MSTHNRSVSKLGFTPGMESLQGDMLALSKARPSEASLGRKMGLAFWGKSRLYWGGGDALSVAALKWCLSLRVGFGREKPLKLAQYQPLTFF